ncbi:MAG TPA: serine/threonine-protein kinase [Solirubrobacterales bacterium]|nr:serine/threonine-protein kinase [Solirubrobacterales bacterium]
MSASEQPTDELPTGRSSLADPPLIAAGRRLGARYRLERRIGHGGMAVVWEATDERLGRRVAVKVLSETFTADRDYLGRFAREARVAAGLQHPNLVDVYDYDAGERPYLVMECVEGGDLAGLLERGEAPSVEQLAEELLAALRHIHDAGVLHRDIKPQNVLVDGYGHARLTDFGIAMPADADSFTRTGELIGTKSYIAPEVMRGAPASERSDLFALGVVLAGAARDGADASAWSLIDRLRDPDPQARPESAEAALAELAAGDRQPVGEPTERFPVEPEPLALAGSGGRPFEPTPTAVRSGWGRARTVALVALCAVAGAAAVTLLAGGSDDPPRTASSGGAGDGSGSGDRSGNADGSGNGAATTDGPAASQEPVAPEPAPEESAPATGGTGGGADPVALNDQGFELVSQGRYEEAVAPLERAVEGLRGSGDEATFNYAMFNLASAYLGAGRPADAIPLLEQRMQFDDGQLGEVEAALQRAYAEAGVAPEGDAKPGNGPKNGKVPPPFEEEAGDD